MANKITEISKRKFEAYKTVRESGITNMFNLGNVITAAEAFNDVELTKKDCIFIMRNYGKLGKTYEEPGQK